MRYVAVPVLIALALGLTLAPSDGAAGVSGQPDKPSLEEMLSPDREEPWDTPRSAPDECFYREYKEGIGWLGPWQVNEDCGPVTTMISEP